MKARIEEHLASARLPDVGEWWKHSNKGHIYMRVTDQSGERFFSGKSAQECFFSVANDGYATYTLRSSTDVQILKPVSVDPDGTIVFKPC